VNCGSGVDRLTMAAFVLMVLLAGGNAVSIKITSGELEPLWGAGVRFGAAGMLFVLLGLLLRVRVPRGAALGGAMLYGALAFGGAFGLLFTAIPMIGAGTAQLLLGLVPLLTLILAPLHGLETVKIRALLGSMVALLGVGILAFDRISLDVHPLGIALAILAALMIAESGVVAKLTPRADPVVTNAVGMITGAALLLPLSLILGERWTLPTQQDTWLAISYLVVVGSLAVFWLFIFVLRRWDASAASFQFLLLPLAAIPFSALLTHEVVTPNMLLGGALMLGGVYLGVLAPSRAAHAEPLTG
jgi:drug/metabolite transporter (DMT)-like permease